MRPQLERDMLQPHPFLRGSPTALRKSPYWAKVMSGSGSSRSHCFRTPVIAWMGKSSSLTAAGSVRQGHVSIVCILTSGAALGTCSQVPTCLQCLA